MTSITIKFEHYAKRRCGECQLCCKLLPTSEIGKPAGKRCEHQKHGVGCGIYPRRPSSCRFWVCRWLSGDDTLELRRPDRSRYVIDMTPDHVTIGEGETKLSDVQVVQIWCDPQAPDAWRDPGLLRYLERRGEEGIAALIRYDNKRAIAVFPPAMSTDGQWHEIKSGTLQEPHTFGETVAALLADTDPTLIAHDPNLIGQRARLALAPGKQDQSDDDDGEHNPPGHCD